jgi:hypothetical protein
VLVTQGQLAPLGAGLFRVDTGSMRAVVDGDRSEVAQIDFVYQGPSREETKLDNGELRRQIGLKLRAKDDCNVVHVMWHIAPSQGVYVSLKSNPGQKYQSQCGSKGYIDMKNALRPNLPPLRPGEKHSLRAELSGSVLRVYADDLPVYQGALPEQLLAPEGPPGVRSDNVAFEFALLLPPVPAPPAFAPDAGPLRSVSGAVEHHPRVARTFELR